MPPPYVCWRCKKDIPPGSVERLLLSSAVYFDPACWSAYVDEVIAEYIQKTEQARQAVGRVADPVRP